MSWFLLAWQRTGEFSGRSRRKEFWYFQLFSWGPIYLLVACALIFGPAIIAEPNKTARIVFGIYGLYMILAIIPSISITVRRLHDAGLSGWWYFISFVPVIGAFILIVMLLLDSEASTNQWGRDPKSKERTHVPPYAMHY